MKGAVVATALFAVMVSAGRAAAQTAHPDYSGVWTLDPAKSTSQPAPVPTAATWTIAEHGDSIVVDRSTTTEQGTAASHAVVATDGKSYQNGIPLPTGETLSTSSTASYDANGLVVITTGSVQGTDFTQTDHWTLGADGKTLTSTRVVTVGGDDVQSATLVFNRKP